MQTATTYQVQQSQTIWDIALQVYGSMKGAWWLIADNTGTLPDLNAVPVAGTVLAIRAFERNDLAKYYLNKQIVIATL
jgi:hypothetical protein